VAPSEIIFQKLSSQPQLLHGKFAQLFPAAGDCDLQGRLIPASFFVHPEGVFKSVEELWDGEI